MVTKVSVKLRLLPGCAGKFTALPYEPRTGGLTRSGRTWGPRHAGEEQGASSLLLPTAGPVSGVRRLGGTGPWERAGWGGAGAAGSMRKGM